MLQSLTNTSNETKDCTSIYGSIALLCIPAAIRFTNERDKSNVLAR